MQYYIQFGNEIMGFEMEMVGIELSIVFYVKPLFLSLYLNLKLTLSSIPITLNPSGHEYVALDPKNFPFA